MHGGNDVFPAEMCNNLLQEVLEVAAGMFKSKADS